MKITKTGFKKFIKDNKENLYYQKKTEFSGITDSIEDAKTDIKKVENYKKLLDNSLIWLVGNSRDYFERDKNKITITNCCGSFEIIIK